LLTSKRDCSLANLFPGQQTRSYHKKYFCDLTGWFYSSARTNTPPASESIRKIEPGPDSGQMRVSLMQYADAASYEVRWAPVGADGAPGAWTSQAIGKIIRSPSTISGLKPATTYVFQARAVKKTGGHSDWSDSVTRVAM
jgi:hypothetical protein